ncbi:hypothetical protein CYMTET_20847 [Cymbomonas tetramitiformis]|uniref:Uncharacterized protein n=1 Tax=Cymbomonas tetramitiformis TaxID=36881 RepID=A0AAE0L3U9_9CHLO|nr:hypothetical protein CYMTET_20847 [Cymbomonas tetramitiformis]|eukprot:gene21088-25319_t
MFTKCLAYAASFTAFITAVAAQKPLMPSSPSWSPEFVNSFLDVTPEEQLPDLEDFYDHYVRSTGSKYKSNGTAWFNMLANRLNPRNPVEQLVLQLRKFVDPDEIFLGIDWFVQARQDSSPKEYHIDTDTTLLNKHDLRICPDTSSIYYITGGAGPTVIFNQTFNEFGLTPRIPQQVAIAWPTSNKLVAFQGDLYHGVLRHPKPKGKIPLRKTLIINWWKERRPLEAQDLDPTYFREVEYRQPIDPSTKSAEDIKKISYDSPFDSYLDDWLHQSIPLRGERLPTSGLQILTFAESGMQLDPHQVIPSWALWVKQSSGEEEEQQKTPKRKKKKAKKMAEEF